MAKKIRKRTLSLESYLEKIVEEDISCCLLYTSEYEFPVNGKCVMRSNCYQLVGDDGKILYGTGFPIGYARDVDDNEYSVFLESEIE